jgi:hypothetical protein
MTSPLQAAITHNRLSNVDDHHPHKARRSLSSSYQVLEKLGHFAGAAV